MKQGTFSAYSDASMSVTDAFKVKNEARFSGEVQSEQIYNRFFSFSVYFCEPSATYSSDQISCQKFLIMLNSNHISSLSDLYEPFR